MAEIIADTDGLKDVCAVWSHNDDMLLGAIPVMRAAGLSAGRDVLTVSVDGVPGYSGRYSRETPICRSKSNPIGTYVFDVVQGYLGGRRDHPKWVVIPGDLHTAFDAAAMLARRED